MFSAPVMIGLLSLAPGCQDGADPADEVGDTSPALQLVFSVEMPASRAGESVGYLAYLDGYEEPWMVEAILASDIQEDMRWDDSTLTPTLVGTSR